MLIAGTRIAFEAGVDGGEAGLEVGKDIDERGVFGAGEELGSL